MEKTDLSKRMKDYEMRNRYYLQKKTPVIIRVDMRAAKTFTKGFTKPFDEVFIDSMNETAKYMCSKIQNVKFAYIQSDEISLVLCDYDKINTDAWFDYRVDKVCSISASLATLAFNNAFREQVCYEQSKQEKEEYPNLVIWQNHCNAIDRREAIFDARVFNLPKEEIVNYIYWRQSDYIRNSINMVGRANFSHRQLQGKSCNEVKSMLLNELNIDWEALSSCYKYGRCCAKTKVLAPVMFYPSSMEEKHESILVQRWQIDKDIPVFKGEGREYIESNYLSQLV